MTFDPALFKQEFPLFNQTDYQQLVYLDNAATTQKPKVVIQAISDFYTLTNANAHRSSYQLSRRATECIETVRQKIASFINAQANNIVFNRGATEGLNFLAYSLDGFIQTGDEIILTSAEHHANLLPWQALARRKNATLRFLPDINGLPDLSALPTLLNEKTAIVTMTLASNVLGYRLPVESVADKIRQHRCIFILDAAQALPHATLDVQTLGCDFLVGSAHKCYGPFGIGFLYGRNEWLTKLPPWQSGGEMVETVSRDTATFAPPPQRFEAGTLALADIAGFGAALDFIQSYDRTLLARHEMTLTQKLHQGLAQFPALRLLSQPDQNIGITTIALQPASQTAHNLADLAHWLDECNIAVRVGTHCAQILYQQLGVSQGLRLSVAPYNSLDDCDRVLQAISQWFEQYQQPSTKKIQQQDEHLPQLPQLQELFAQQVQGQAAYRNIMQAGALMPEQLTIRQKNALISGCEANTWLAHTYIADRHYFTLDSESRVVRGLGGLMLTWFQGQTAEHILQFNWQAACEHMGLQRYLSSSRRNGFRALINQAHNLVRKTSSTKKMADSPQ